MNEIITAAMKQKNIGPLVELPPNLLHPEESDLIKWIVGYFRSYSQVPPYKRLKEQFPSFVAYDWKAWGEDMPPVGDLVDVFISERIKIQSLGLLTQAEEALALGKDPSPFLMEITQLQQLGEGLLTLSEFDREQYRRSHALDFPIRNINGAINGLGSGDYMLIAGRLGTGKSTVLQHLAVRYFNAGKTVLFVSTEMGAVDVFSRIDSMLGGFNPLVLRRTDGLDALKSNFKKVYGALDASEGGIIVPKRRLPTPQAIGAMAKNLDVDIILVDGVYLLSPSHRANARWEQVTAVSNELKQTALDIKKPIIGTVQIKRGAERRGGHYTDEAISQSDAFAQDADFVITLFKDEMDDVFPGIELDLIKNRYGPNISCYLDIDYNTMSIKETAKSEFKTVEDL